MYVRPRVSLGAVAEQLSGIFKALRTISRKQNKTEQQIVCGLPTMNILTCSCFPNDIGLSLLSLVDLVFPLKLRFTETPISGTHMSSLPKENIEILPRSWS